MSKICSKCGWENENEFVCTNCGKQLSKDDKAIKTNEKQPTNKNNSTVFGWFFLIFVLFAIIISCANDITETQIKNNENNEDYVYDVLNRKLCDEKTNTYYKCHWSEWEDRCVCEAR